MTVESLVRLFGSAAELAEIGPDLSISAGVPIAERASPAGRRKDDPAAAKRRGGLAEEGFAGLGSIAAPATSAALVRAIDALRARDLPAVFAYAFDEAWAIGEEVRARVSATIGREYRLVEDVWAWRIPTGTAGWPPHRGIAHALLDRDAPEIVNAWVALSDVTADRACMHAVPLDDDPGYPTDLARVDAPLVSVRALPVSAGDTLFWNANVLHWGGRCAASAPGARVSCSFTLCRADAAPAFADLTLLAPLDALDLGARMDVLARMILLYGGAERGDVQQLVREWANLTHALASRFGRRDGPS
jgi:hypothetical protein